MFSAMDIYVIAVTPDLIFKRFPLSPIFYRKNIIALYIRRLSLTPSSEAVFTTKALEKVDGRTSFMASRY